MYLTIFVWNIVYVVVSWKTLTEESIDPFHPYTTNDSNTNSKKITTNMAITTWSIDCTFDEAMPYKEKECQNLF